MEATWKHDHDEPFGANETRTAKIAVGAGYIQLIDVEFVDATDAPYEMYHTDPYFAALDDDVQEALDTLVGLSTMGLTEYVSMQEPCNIPTA